MKPLRILILTSSNHPIVDDIFKEMQKHVDAAYYFSIPAQFSLLKELLKNILTLLANLNLVVLFSEIIFKNLTKFSIRVLVNWYFHLLYLILFEKKNKFDIIDAHWIYPAGTIASIYGKHCKKRVIITAHGYDADDRTFKNKEKTNLVLSTAKHSYKILTAEKRLYNNLSEHGINNIILTNQFVNFPNRKIDTKNLRIKLEIPINSFVIVFGPKIMEEYGVFDFVNAVLKIHEKIPNLFVAFLGPGDKNNLKIKMSKKNINYKIYGNVLHSELLNYLEVSDLVCNTSFAGQGIFTMESWAFSKPVIGYNIGEVKIENEVTGLVCEPGNIEQLSKLILKLYQDEVLRKKLGENGKKKLDESYSKEKRIQDIFDVFYN